MCNYIKTKGNIKLGKSMGTISKLAGNQAVYVKALDAYFKGTCGSYCQGCQGDGINDIMHAPYYVFKSYRYDSVRVGHARTTAAFRRDIYAAFEAMHAQLCRKRKKFEYVRINQSGELETVTEFRLYIWLANQHPETVFYLYTKAFDCIREVVNIPSNLWINISIWGEYGIKEYLEFSALSSQIKAFVCVTDTYTIDWYAEHGIVIQAMCRAYDERGRLNHDITCDKCPLCHSNVVKITGCYEH